ncbi:threonine synthase [Salinarchaeum sp. Harcht-Bsk1]|uniref:threonine synthase n=1 Tax=Salinarchaeum sp. Harcht-Bsk1 TaxID=1333523 RepID=UPI000342280C|nr:threonine synthase [Salinarchaeum sp. Harcht-Bsk1]AGN02940.1 threonine synthase [Salinarchaeum sp. Harcht-Bsk1]
MAVDDPTPTDLQCSACGATYEAGPDEPWRCSCGSPLDFAENPVPQGSPPPFSRLDTRRGLWAFFEFLPVTQQVTLGEGFTPLVGAPEWNAQFKLEYVFPTGSFKDRGATTTLSRAAELGVDTIVEDSSGNAGASIATYAARANVDAEIYVPGELPQSKLMAIQRAGARPVRIDGSREDVSEACIEAVEDGDAWYASHAWNPAFLAGTMTFALEVAAQRDWSIPDAVVLPTGNGTLSLGAYRGFKALEDAGMIDDVPRIMVAQASGYAPIVDALDGVEPDPITEEPDDVPDVPTTSGGLGVSIGDDGDDDRLPDNELADGIQIRDPPRKDQIVAAVQETDGAAIEIGENQLEIALDRLHRSGFYVEPTCAVGPAALRAFRDEGILADDADVVVALTGSGLKTL